MGGKKYPNLNIVADNGRYTTRPGFPVYRGDRKQFEAYLL